MWRYDRPDKEGFYYCTLIANVNEKNVAYGDRRAFRVLDSIAKNYRMEGEPLTGLGWVRDADGFKTEKVIAWSENETTGVCDQLPEGTIIVKAMDQTE